MFINIKGDHVYNLNAVFRRFYKVQLYVKASKCALYFKKVEFLGYVVSEYSVSVQTSRIDTVRDWPETISSTNL